MPELKRSFQSGRMNKDLDERLVPNGEYRDALNIEISTSEEDDVGSAQTTMGNKKIFGQKHSSAYLPDPTVEYPSLGGLRHSFYRNKTIGSVVDEKNNWGYRFVAGPPPQINTNEWPAFFDQKNYISADYIIRSNTTFNEPVLVDIYSVAVGRYSGWTIPSSPTNTIRVPDIIGLREGMELNVYVVDVNGAVTNRGNTNTLNKKPPKIKKFLPLANPNYRDIELTGKINLEVTRVNNLVFTAPRVLNFEHDNLITGINIIDDFLFWTDNHSEPKKIHIPKSVLGCRHPGGSAGGSTWETHPFNFYIHTNFVTKTPPATNPSFDFWLGDEDSMLGGGRPIEEKHITVIKESPHLTPVLEMVKARGDVNTSGAVLNRFSTSNATQFNPFFKDMTATGIWDKAWVSFGGPDTNPLIGTPIPLVPPGCSPVWTAGCSIDFSVVPLYNPGDIVIFTIPGKSPEIRAEILIGPDWHYGSYEIKIISSSGGIVNTDKDWVSKLETKGELFEFKFPRFATRYKYEDGEYSTYSPFTEVAFLPGRIPMNYLPEKGYNLNMTNNIQELAIKGFIPHNELLPDDVESIEIVYKESDSSNIYSVITVNRNDPEKWMKLGLTTSTSGMYHWNKVKGYVKISSEMIQGAIAPNQLLRHWDNVPRKALAQEMTGNRLLYGNYLQNYDLSALDKINCGSSSSILTGCEAVPEVETDLYFSISSLQHVGVLQPEEENVSDAWKYGPAKSIKTLRTYQLGVVYRDKYGRETPVFSSVDMTKYHEKANANKANLLTASIKNVIPDFAESFKFFIKETSNEYYNLPMDRWYDAEDGNIWLSFPSSERSKITIGTDEERFESKFLILKKEHGNNNFVSDPARYKILAVENDAPNFIKTVKNSLGVLSGTGSAIFSVGSTAPQSLQGFPTPLYDFVRIPTTPFEDMGWNDTVSGPNVVNDLKIRIGTSVIKSKWYDIISASPVTGATEYEIKVSKDFGGDMIFSISNNLEIEIVEEAVKYLPEFDGRFFVKIHRDPTLESTLLAPQIAAASSYQVISSMLCQVIDPNSDWSTGTTPDSWDGWGTSNDNHVSDLAPLNNYALPVWENLHSSGSTPGQGANAYNTITPLDGPKWTISSNHGGDGEQYWTGFEAQDNLFGSGNASRWFIDGRSGKNQMFQTWGKVTAGKSVNTEWADLSSINYMGGTNWEIDDNANIIGTPISNTFSKQTSWNGVVASIPNNPTINQDTGRPDIFPLGPPPDLTWQPWSETQPGNVLNIAARFKSPSEGIYDDPVTGDKTMIDLSCMGFGGPEINPTLPSWSQQHGLPYSAASDLAALTTSGYVTTFPLICNTNCNSAFLANNTTQYAADVVFISAITTPGAVWRWAEDPDQTLYTTQNSTTQISDWDNTGGTLGGWKRVGESSVHFNTQTIGISSISIANDITIFNAGNNYAVNTVIGQLPADTNVNTSLVALMQAVGSPGLAGESSSNTANWNRSQRWTIEARTMSGDALGSGPAGYLPTNDPRWVQGNTAIPVAGANPAGKAPGVRHDGMGSGETISTGVATTSTDGSGIVNAPADYNSQLTASTSKTSGSFTWQVLLPQSSLNAVGGTGSFTSGNPAIWETEPATPINLDIYYEIGQIYATKLNERTCTLHAPVGSEVKIYRPADSPYAQLNPGIPTGWLPWLAGPMFVGSWNDFSGTALSPLDPTFPNEIQIVDVNGNPSTDLSNKTSPYPGDILVFYRADGSTTEAMVWGDITTINQAKFNLNKQSGFVTLDEYVGNKHIRLPWFNCYSFGNGVESNRIRDDFNEVIIDKGPKASTTTSIQYKEERRSSGLIFSGIFNSKTGINNLNQFIEAEGITKDLNPTYGSIQKLYSRNTDIVTLCEDKCLKVLANKDALFNADGNINMISTPNVLGQAIAYAGDYGISKNPESFAAASFRAYFTDKNRGTVLRLSQDGLTPISNVGMKDWFSDNLPNAYEIIGSFDSKKGDYNLTMYGQGFRKIASPPPTTPCSYTRPAITFTGLPGNTVSFNENVRGWSSFKSFLQEQGFSLNNNYYTSKHGFIYKHHSDQPTLRNYFYGEQYDSSITLLFNESPGSVKSFNTLNYEGSQSKISRDISAISAGDSYDDFEYYDNIAKDGWYINKMTTNLQETDDLEFKDKEGKWFAQIKGDTTTIDNIDPREFSFQGIDKTSTDPGIAACVDGCTDSFAVNYDPLATCDDGSCICKVSGCTDNTACNWYINANFDDGSCTYPGCTNPNALNYNSIAGCDDGSCILPAPCVDPVATFKSGSGKIEQTCGNFLPSRLTFYVDTNNSVSFDWTITDLSQNVVVGSGIAAPSGSANPITISPITPDPALSPGTNYWIDVTDENGCSYSGLLANLSSTELVYGCMDPQALNYNSAAVCSDSSCIAGCTTPTFSVTNIQQTTATMQWTNPFLPQALTYEIIYTCASCGAFGAPATSTIPINAGAPGATQTYGLTGLVPNTSYTLTLQATCTTTSGAVLPVGGNTFSTLASISGCMDSGSMGQTWWNANYATSTGIATYPGVAANNYIATNTIEDGSCTYSWKCNAALTTNVNGYWGTYEGCASKIAMNIGVTPSIIHVVGDGSSDVAGANAPPPSVTNLQPNNGLDNVALIWFFESANQAENIENYKYLDTNSKYHSVSNPTASPQTRNTYTSTSPPTGYGACPDIRGPATDDPLIPQPAYWKQMSGISLQENQLGIPTWASTHTTVEDFLSELISSGPWATGTFALGDSYVSVASILKNDHFWIKLESSWCACFDWIGAQCVIDSSGTHATKSICNNAGTNCCPGLPTNPPCY